MLILWPLEGGVTKFNLSFSITPIKKFPLQGIRGIK
jgi:hypothetical protein